MELCCLLHPFIKCGHCGIVWCNADWASDMSHCTRGIAPLICPKINKYLVVTEGKNPAILKADRRYNTNEE